VFLLLSGRLGIMNFNGFFELLLVLLETYVSFSISFYLVLE
jgi:hypothetical protein